MKRYLFTISLLLLLLIAAAVHPSIKDIEFINREYALDSKYLSQLIDFSLKHDIRIETLHNWIMAESSGRERAYNRKSKDYGFCQLHDVEYLVKKYWSCKEIFDKWNGEHNLFIGLAYLSDLINELGTEKGFMAYNIGRSRILRGEVLECGVAYVAKILPEEPPEVYIVPFKVVTDCDLRLVFWQQELYDKRRKYV